MSADQSNGGSKSGSQAPPQPSLWGYVGRDPLATSIFMLRMTTIISTSLYLLSSVGLGAGLMQSAYHNAMLSAFFTFGLRLYQRKTQSQVSLFSKGMLSLLAQEDSGHYVIYTIFFYNQTPLAIYLLPPFLYAIVFSSTYTEGLKPFLPAALQNLLTSLNQRITAGQREAFRFIAYTEIFLMLVVIWNVISGYMFILAPFLYFHFLRNRYLSQRNPYIRNSFTELKHGVTQLSQHPRCPTFLSSLVSSAVSLLSKLAPTQHTPGQS